MHSRTYRPARAKTAPHTSAFHGALPRAADASDKLPRLQPALLPLERPRKKPKPKSYPDWRVIDVRQPESLPELTEQVWTSDSPFSRTASEFRPNRGSRFADQRPDADV